MNENHDYIAENGEQGTINISEDVVVAIAAESVEDIEGVKCLASNIGVDFADFLGKKNVSKGVKVVLNGNQVTTDIYVMIKYGYVIPNVARKIQEAVTSSIESMTGLKAAAVNIHVTGVTLEKQAKPQGEAKS